MWKAAFVYGWDIDMYGYVIPLLFINVSVNGK